MQQQSTHKIYKELQEICANNLCFVAVCKWLFSFLNMTISRSLCSSFLVLYILLRVHNEYLYTYTHNSTHIHTTQNRGVIQ